MGKRWIFMSLFWCYHSEFQILCNHYTIENKKIFYINIFLQTSFVVDEVSNVIKEVSWGFNILHIQFDLVILFQYNHRSSYDWKLLTISCYVYQSIEGAIGGNAYQHNKVNQWTSSVVEQCLNQLTKLGKPFKYIGTFFTW